MLPDKCLAERKTILGEVPVAAELLIEIRGENFVYAGSGAWREFSSGADQDLCSALPWHRGHGLRGRDRSIGNRTDHLGNPRTSHFGVEFTLFDALRGGADEEANARKQRPCDS